MVTPTPQTFHLPDALRGPLLCAVALAPFVALLAPGQSDRAAVRSADTAGISLARPACAPRPEQRSPVVCHGRPALTFSPGSHGNPPARQAPGAAPRNVAASALPAALGGRAARRPVKANGQNSPGRPRAAPAGIGGEPRLAVHGQQRKRPQATPTDSPVTIVVVATPTPVPPRRPSGPPPTPHSVGYDRHSFLVDGRRVMLFGGEYQFWRTPAPDRWPVVLAEMRAAGLNTVTVGVSWQYQSPAPGVYDFSGIRDLGRFLDDAAAAGLYVIARPGPAYNAESSASSLPGWLLARSRDLRDNRGHAYCGADVSSPVYAAAYTDWYRHVLPIIAARQLTNGGGAVIAMQIENEYTPQCGSLRYMSELHDLARQMGIDVPLIANNNTCCAPTGAWHVQGDDGEPIVDIPAEDDYPCPGTCSPNWNGRIFSAVDTMEARLRAAGVTAAPIAVAELQGGYFTGWGGPSYARLSASLGPSFTEVLDGSALGQGATLTSIYMVAGGTSWGYMAGPDTATSYDYAAPIHEWGQPGPAYDSLKRTGMFVQAFADALTATRPVSSVVSSNARLLYAVRESVEGSQRGARLIVLRNTDPRRWSATRLRLTVDGHAETLPRQGAVSLPPHSLYLLLAGLNLGPSFRLRYSTSRPLTAARVNGQEILVLYGVPGTDGETALAFAHRPALLYVDRGIAVTYDARAAELRLDYRHAESLRYVALAGGSHRLLIVLTGPATAAHTWRLDVPGGQILAIGPRMIDAVSAKGGAVVMRARIDGAASVTVWAPGPTRGISAVGARASAPFPRPRAGSASSVDAGSPRALLTARYDTALRASVAAVTVQAPPLVLPRLSVWRFRTESPEVAPSFDDSRWTPADEMATNNPNVPKEDTLLADDYGFHDGFAWYRGVFTGATGLRYLRLYARNSYSVWLNGRYIGSSSVHNDLKNVDDQFGLSVSTPWNGAYADGIFYRIPPGLVKAGASNTIAVLVESLGHNTGFSNGERARSPFGILDARLIGPIAPPAIAWKIQGGAGAGSPLNASGLYGERHGWYAPGFDDSAWSTVRVPDTWTSRGLRGQGIGWYRTAFDLRIPRGVDAPLGLVIPHAEDKVVIWLNGLLIGRYWDGAGPQHIFYLPAGLLHERGHNVLALAVWNRGHRGGLTGGVYLRPYSVDTNVDLRVAGS